MKRYYSVANITIEIAGTKELNQLLSNHFKGSEVLSAGQKIDMIITFIPKNMFVDEIAQYYSLSGKIGFNEENFYIKYNKYTLLAENFFNQDVSRLSVYHDDRRTAFSILKNVIKTFVLPTGIITLNNSIIWEFMSYSSYMYLFHLMLLKKDKAFVHGSVASIENQAILFSGTGGCGKTSSLFELLKKREFKYLAEDYGIISSKGKTYFNPKHASIYNSDVSFGQDDLKNYINKEMPKFDRVLWSISKMLGLNPMRRISPSKLLGDNRIAKQADLSKVYFFQRSSSDNVTYYKISIEEGVERILKASFRELKALYELSYNVEAVGSSSIKIQPLNSIMDATRNIYMKAFKKSDIYLVNIPQKSGPIEILNQIGLIEK